MTRITKEKGDYHLNKEGVPMEKVSCPEKCLVGGTYQKRGGNHE